MTTDAERIAYLSGDPSAALDDPDEVAALDELRNLLGAPGLWEEPPADLEDSVVAAVSGVAGQGTTGEAAPAVPTVAPLAGRRRRWAGPLLGALAAAAAVVVAVLVVTTGSDEPQGYQAALAGSELTPEAQGTVILVPTDSGWRIDLDATGLPRLNDGRYYQAWLRRADDVLVPIGSFNEGTDVILWSGVSPKQFSTFIVTEEEADGDQASSGQRVLAGPIVEAD
ncbi:MAG: anti-sigma factor [Acidimicrobiales bacterium]